MPRKYSANVIFHDGGPQYEKVHYKAEIVFDDDHDMLGRWGTANVAVGLPEVPPGKHMAVYPKDGDGNPCYVKIEKTRVEDEIGVAVRFTTLCYPWPGETAGA